VDGVFGYGDDICLIFDLEFERSSLQAVGDEVTAHTLGFILGTFHLDDERMDLVVVAVVCDDVDDCCRVGSDVDLFFEGSLFHAADYTSC
jgi:hypothetical protein